jgi:HJR/Mrr/RecB family endonuclease
MAGFKIDSKWQEIGEKIAKQQRMFSLSPAMEAYIRSNEKMMALAKPVWTASKLSAMLAALPQADKMILTSSYFDKISSFTKMAESISQEQYLFKSYLNSIGQMQRLSSVTAALPVFDFDRLVLNSIKYNLIPEPEAEEPVSKIILLDEAKRVKSIIKSVYHDHTELYRIEPRSFEEMIGELLRDQGFSVELTKQTRDGGYDLIAIQDLAGIPVKFLVECKRHANDHKVNVNIVRSFSDVMSNAGTMGMIVTSSYFTRDAKQYPGKNRPWLLHYRDHDDVISWVNQYISPMAL